MHKAFFVALGATLILGGGCAAPHPSASTNDTASTTDVSSPVFETITVSSTKNKLSYDVTTPVMRSGLTETARLTFNDRMALNANKMIRAFTDDYALTAAEEETLLLDNPWSMSVEPLLPTSTSRLQSVVLQGYQYTGGAHGLLWHQTELFDLNEYHFLTLDDLFEADAHPLQQLASSTNAALMEREFISEDPDWVNDGTQPKPENFQRFFVTPDGISVIFSDYQVAPHAAGPQTVTIPWSALRGMKAEYQPI